MAIVKIQHRRGNYADFDPTKLLPAELAVVQNGDPSSSDGEAIYISPKAGSVKQLATKDQMQSEIETILATELPIATAEATAEAEAAADRAEAAAETLEIDDTLTHSRQAADAKKTGDEISDLKSAISEIEPGLSNDAKVALLNCFQHVAWIDEYGQTYYDALESALYADQYPKITALFNPGLNVIYTDDTLDSLKQYLTVKYYENEESSGTTIGSSDYSLSGTLTVGTSIINVTYNNFMTTFSVIDVINFYDIWEWSWSASGGNLEKLHGSSEPGQQDATMYPSLVALNAPYEIRRTYCVTRGLSPFYEYLKTAIPTQYYPIPIPSSANHVKITTAPTGQYIYLTFYEYDDGQYTPRLGRTTWTELTNGVFERGLALGSGNQRFLIFNMKYDNAGASYPVEPTSMVIEFSEAEE